MQHPEEFGSATMGPGIYLERGIKACDGNIHGRRLFQKEGNLKRHPRRNRADTDIWHVHRTRQFLLQYLCGAICGLVPFKPLFTQAGRRAFILPRRPV